MEEELYSGVLWITFTVPLLILTLFYALSAIPLVRIMEQVEVDYALEFFTSPSIRWDISWIASMMSSTIFPYPSLKS